MINTLRCLSFIAFVTTVASLLPRATTRTFPWRLRCPFVKLSATQRSSSTSAGVELAEISNQMKQAYIDGGTDGALAWALSTGRPSDPTALPKARIVTMNRCGSDLLEAAARSFPKSKSAVSGIINALFGACLSLALDASNSTNNSTTAQSAAELTVQILRSYEDVSRLTPNLVTLCLAYSTLMVCATTSPRYQDLAEDVLERANNVFPWKLPPTNSSAASVPLSPGEREALHADYGVKVLTETESYLIVSKPSGMVCYRDPTKDNGNSQQTFARSRAGPSLEEVLLDCHRPDAFPLSTLNEVGRGFVHRIDQGTSGCILLAKTNSMHAQLLAQFFLRRVQKTYRALVYCPDNSLIIREREHRDTTTATATQTSSKRKEGTAVLSIGGKPAQSDFLVEDVWYGSKVAAVRVKPLQGRKHQVRIHCSLVLGAPILLDPLYGGEAIMFHVKGSAVLPQLRAQKRFCLHAETLSIPQFGIHVQAEEPLWWKNVTDAIQQNIDDV